MKTAISIPDEVFNRAERRAEDLHMSRSEFYARALQRYLGELEACELSGQIDEALTHIGEDDSNVAAVAAGRRRIVDSSGEW